VLLSGISGCRHAVPVTGVTPYPSSGDTVVVAFVVAFVVAIAV
jgi:hypothetical protein